LEAQTRGRKPRKRLIWGHREFFPKSYANGIVSGRAVLSQSVSLGGFGSGLAEQASWNIDECELSSLLWHLVGLGFHNDLDSFVAGVDFNPYRAIFEIDFVAPAGFAADYCMGHVSPANC